MIIGDRSGYHLRMQGRESLQKVIGSLKDKKFKCKINIRSNGPKEIKAKLRTNGNS